MAVEPVQNKASNPKRRPGATPMDVINSSTDAVASAPKKGPDKFVIEMKKGNKWVQTHSFTKREQAAGHYKSVRLSRVVKGKRISVNGKIVDTQRFKES
jgi:arylamine N-acetyltransferase